VFLKSVFSSKFYLKSLAQLCHQELVQQLQYFLTLNRVGWEDGPVGSVACWEGGTAGSNWEESSVV